MLLHLEGLAEPPPHLPYRGIRAGADFVVSGVFHMLGVVVVAVLFSRVSRLPASRQSESKMADPIATRHIVFIARDDRPSGGGGGGGNRQHDPIRRAEGIGDDAITLRIARQETVANTSPARDALPAVLLDARPLASGMREVIGLPEGAVSSGISRGPGDGDGVGDRRGSGIGDGSGPGLGPGVYRVGGSVTSPRVIREVKPSYTNDAMMRRLQGTVVLELIVRSDGRPDEIRVVRSLDAGGLDDHAVDAARQWRFEPGRLAGMPVDVLVTVFLDFTVR